MSSFIKPIYSDAFEKNLGTLDTPNNLTVTTYQIAHQYASRVIAFSSQYSSGAWSAQQAVGAPNTATYGDISTSWTSSVRDANGDREADEFITLGFATPVYANGIEIRETYGNGFVRSVDLLDTNGTYRSVWSGNDTSPTGRPVDFLINFNQTDYAVVGARINVDIDQTSVWEEIDSVKLIGVVAPLVTLAVSPSSVTEDGTGKLIYTFTRTGSLTSPLTVNYTVGGTATLNSDYTQSGANSFNATTGTITFAAGSSTKAITIDPTPDTVVEANETVALRLSAGTGYIFGTTPSTVTGTITNDDFLPNITLAVSPSSVTENGTVNLIYTFTRTGSLTSPLTVNYTVGGTATLNSDYTQSGANSFNATTGTITFAAGSSTKAITIDPTPDTVVEANETVALRLSAGTGYTVGTPSTVTGTILGYQNTEQYASRVITFSSQYSPGAWSAQQAVGAPNTATYGDISTSWTSRVANANGDREADEFITLGFATPVYANGIEIRETYGNGFVRSVDLLDTSGTYRSVWSGNDTSPTGRPVDFLINFNQTAYAVVGARINVDIDQTSVWEEIDSVKLIGIAATNTVSRNLANIDGLAAATSLLDKSNSSANHLTNLLLGNSATLQGL